MDPITTALLASLASGLATGVGALPALLFKSPSERLFDAMLGFAAGIMIAVSMFGLLVPAFRLGGVSITILGSIIGIAFLDASICGYPIYTDCAALKVRRLGCAGSGSCC